MAVNMLGAGAITSTAYPIAALPFAGDTKGHVLGHRLTATPLVATVPGVLRRWEAGAQPPILVMKAGVRRPSPTLRR